MGFPVGDQVDFMLPLLGLKAVLGSAVVADTAAAQDDDDGPHQPEPPEFIVVVAALRLSTAVSCVTDVALIVGTHAGFLIRIEGCCWGVTLSKVEQLLKRADHL